MSDDRISPTPIPPPCPVCATGFTATPGTACPACGRTALHSTSVHVPDFRLPPTGNGASGYDNPVHIFLGILFAVIVGLFAIAAPGVLIPVAVFLGFAGIRTARLMSMAKVHEAKSTWGYLFSALLASFGIAVLLGAASAVAFAVVCTTIGVLTDFAGIEMGLIVGGLVALVGFLVLFIRFWPREKADPWPPNPDPEN